jgi:FAD synthetase
MNKALQSNQVEDLAAELKYKKAETVIVGGVFDIVHPGHVEFLERAKREGDVLVVLLESDQNVKLRKGESKPLNTQTDRARVLAAFGAVDYVICLPFMERDQDYDHLVTDIQPKVIVTTKSDPGLHHKKRQAKLVGAQIKELPLMEGYSTGQIISKILGKSSDK